ncbi:uncharacterized protein LOC143029444 [Oratosquilla oratoria]|uniref:uncharacterized protein LOC143029444 n=1 Tax=Oratosquilla oratoria TaxID=337810 RepID=UPI003F77463A
MFINVFNCDFFFLYNIQQNTNEIYGFTNLVTGVHVAQATVRGGLGIGMLHIGDTTIAVATNSGLFFYDLVGSTLVATRAQVPPSVIPESAIYTSICISQNDNVYAGCADGSIMEFERRTAIRCIACPQEDPSRSPSSPFSRLLIAAGGEAVFTVHSEGNLVIARCYAPREGKIAFKSDASVAAPSSDWVPTSLSLGSTKLVIGARRQQPFLLIDIKSGRINVIDISKKSTH